MGQQVKLIKAINIAR